MSRCIHEQRNVRVVFDLERLMLLFLCRKTSKGLIWLVVSGEPRHISCSLGLFLTRQRLFRLIFAMLGYASGGQGQLFPTIVELLLEQGVLKVENSHFEPQT